MAVYAGDKPEWFRAAVQSAVFEQTRPPDQVVLVIDGPVSLEYEVVIDRIRRLEDSKIIRLKVNSGLAAALNEGLKHCTSDYVARFDSDDICHPRRIELQMEYLESFRNVDVLGTQILEYDENMRFCYGLRMVPCDHDSIKDFSKKRSPLNHMTVIYRRSTVNSVGGYPRLQGREDYGLWIKLLGDGYNFANLPDVLVFSRGGLPMLKRRGGKKHVVPEWKLHNYKIANNIYLKNYSYLILILRIIVAILPISLRGLCYRLVRVRGMGQPVGFAETGIGHQVGSERERAGILVPEIPFHVSKCGKTIKGIETFERANRGKFQDRV